MSDGLIIALIDDEEIICENLAHSLRRAGYVVHPYISVEKFLAESTWKTAHLIVTDVSMPRIDGYTLCRKLEAQGYMGLFAFITAGAEPQELKELRLKRPFVFIQKPFRTREFLTSVEEFLKKWKNTP